VLIVFLGIVCGYALALIAPEEILPGKKHLYMAACALLGLYFGSLEHSFAGIVIAACSAMLIFYIGRFYIWYILAGAFVYSAQGNIASLGLLFLAGFPIATLDAQEYVDDDKITDWKSLLKKVLIKYSAFIPVAFLPFLLSNL